MSDSIAFQASSQNSEESESIAFQSSTDGAALDTDRSEPEEKKEIEIRFMYIQMEFCDKQTLRSAIDAGMYKDTQRVWRMFRVN